MASGWKSQRGMIDKSQGHKLTVGGHNSRAESVDRGEVPQRPPTVGQELPNNLVPTLQDWQLETSLKPNKNRKKGNIDIPKEKHTKIISAVENGPNGVSFNSSMKKPGHVTHQHGQSKSRVVASEAESTSDGDNIFDGAQGTNAKRHTKRIDSQSGSFISESDVARSKHVHNSAKRLDTNQVVGTLVQVRDYIKQVTFTMEALENTRNPGVFEKLEKLRKVRADLLKNEHRLVDLLQRASIIQSDQCNEDSSNSEVGSVPSNHGALLLTNVDGTSDVSSEEGSYSRQNELLQKVTESQEKLKELQEQQTLLVALQQKTEHRLAQARSIHDQLANKTNGNESSSLLTTDEIAASRMLESDLRNIHQRLALLKDMQITRERNESLDRSVDGEPHASDKQSKAFYEKEYRELQSKLQDLEIKKKHMDDLLKELYHFRESQAEDTTQSSPVTSQSETKPLTVTKDSIETMQQSLQLVDTNEKMRKLDEMKSWLYNMQEMVSNLRSESNRESPADPQWQSYSNCPESSSLEQNRNVPAKLKREKKSKTDNLSREQSNENVARLAIHHGVHSNTDHGHHRKESSVDLSLEIQDHNLDEKARQLHATKTKLQKLQNLLSAVQHSQHGGQPMSVEHAEHLLNLIENEDEDDEEESFASNRATNRSSTLNTDQGVTSSHGDPGIQSSLKSVSKPAINRIGKQHWQSDVVMDDQVTATKGERSSHKCNSSRDGSTPVTKLSDSNHDLWLEMRHQMALQEELRQRKRELECLMRKDGGKNYLLNQDTQSENFSVSAKSEPVLAAASVGATDLTSAATWGGSSVDNCARDTVDGNDSQEDQNERVDNEEYSSEEPLEAENMIASSGQPNESCINKPINSLSAGYNIEGDGGWGMTDIHHRTSLGGASNGEYVHGLSTLTGNSLSHSKNAKQQPERTLIQDGSEFQMHDDPFGYDTTGSLPGPVNAPPNIPPLQQQMEMATLLCQTILRDQNVLSGMIQQPSSTNAAAAVQLSSGISVADIAHHQHVHLVQQQLLLGLSHCYHLLYLQNLEIQRLRQILQNPVPSGITYTDSQCTRPVARTRANLCENVDCQNTGLQWHLDNPSLARLSMSSSPSQPPFHQLHHQQPTLSSHPSGHQESAPQGSTTETLNNQVPPGNRANNYWDNFRSYSRQNLLSSSTSQPNKSNDCPGGHCQLLPRGTSSAPTSHLKISCHRGHCNSSHSNEDLQMADAAASFDGTSQSRISDSQARCMHNASGPFKVGVGALQSSAKDKINKDISSLTISTNLLKNCGKSASNSALSSQVASIDSLQTGALCKLAAKQDCNKTNMGARERVSQSSVSRPVRSSSVSRADPVEESVYDEVSKLVTHFNESPHYLIQILRELRKLNSEKAAHDAIQALHSASSASGALCDVEASTTAVKAFSSQTGMWTNGAKPKLLRRESSSSSDEGGGQADVLKKRRDLHQFASSRVQYDASANLVLPNSSKPRLPSDRNFFGRLHVRDLGNKSDTQPPKVMACNRKGEKPGDWQLSGLYPLPPKQEKSVSTGPVVAQSRKNDSTTSDAPCSRFNMQQLESQMTSIMSSIALFVSSFSHHTCNSNLISTLSSHICALVLPFMHNYNQDTPNQLMGIVESVIQKYSCKRIGDVEESLLSDLSDVLFNELAFFQLLQNMDGHSAQMRLQKFHSLAQAPVFLNQRLACQPREMATKSERCNTIREDSAAEIKVPANSVPNPLCTSGHSEATDADLVVMARRGDDENNDKGHEDFSCDIPDVCAGRGGMTGAVNSIGGDEVIGFRAVHHNSLGLDPHSLSPPPLPDLGALAAAAEGQGEGRYFDQEVEMEGEGLGDTQDLAEADQSQGYMEAESALDDVQEGEHFQAWGIDHGLMNGGIDRTEDDQHNEDDPLGATGGSCEFSSVEQAIMDISRTELGLDEVPIKLRDGINAGSSNARERSKEDAVPETPEYDELKSKRNDHSGKQ